MFPQHDTKNIAFHYARLLVLVKMPVELQQRWLGVRNDTILTVCKGFSEDC